MPALCRRGLRGIACGASGRATPGGVSVAETRAFLESLIDDARVADVAQTLS